MFSCCCVFVIVKWWTFLLKWIKWVCRNIPVLISSLHSENMWHCGELCCVIGLRRLLMTVCHLDPHDVSNFIFNQQLWLIIHNWETKFIFKVTIFKIQITGRSYLFIISFIILIHLLISFYLIYLLIDSLLTDWPTECELFFFAFIFKPAVTDLTERIANKRGCRMKRSEKTKVKLRRTKIKVETNQMWLNELMSRHTRYREELSRIKTMNNVSSRQTVVSSIKRDDGKTFT